MAIRLLLLVTLNAVPKSFSVESNNPADVFVILGLSSNISLFFKTIQLPVSSSSTHNILFWLETLRLSFASASVDSLASLNCVM